MDQWYIVLGTREGWGKEGPFVLTPHDRRHHLYVVGKSGTGKTTLLRNLILQDIVAGHGVGVIDPHGDLVSDVLDHIPSHRIEDMVYFNPADLEHPVGLDLLGQTPPDSRHLVASGIVGVFKSAWPDFWGPRTEYILYAIVAALLDCENVSLLGIPRMLSDGRYRAWVIRQVKDPLVRSFWVNEFAAFNRTMQHEMVAPSSSGQSHCDLSITKAGNARVRWALIELAWRMVLYQPQSKAVQRWGHLLLNPKAATRQKKRALVALARQLAVDLWRWQTGKVTPEQLGWVMV